MLKDGYKIKKQIVFNSKIITVFLIHYDKTTILIIYFKSKDDVRPCCKATGVSNLCLDHCIQAAYHRDYESDLSKSCKKYQDAIKNCFEDGSI